MLKSKPKVQKKLAKIVMASLLLSGVLPGMMSPSLAEARVATYEIAGTVTKAGGTTVSFTQEDVEGSDYYAYAIGSKIYMDKTGDYSSVAVDENTDPSTITVDGYTMEVTKNTYSSGEFIGAASPGTVSNNTVTFKASDVPMGYYYVDVIGGQGANATKNTVNIEAGKVEKAIGGLAMYGAFIPGAESASGDANNENTVNINNGTVGVAIGGMARFAGFGSVGGGGSSADGGNANGNFVNMNGGNVAVIAGGSTMDFSTGYGFMYGYNYPNAYTATDGTANDNTVTITDGTLGSTYDYYDSDEGETETWKFGGFVVGGLSMKEASGNKVTVKGGNVDGAYVIGGWIPQWAESAVSADELDEASESVNASAKADNNTVNILTSANFTGLYGGITSMSETGLTFGSGNTLNVAAKDVTTYDVGGFSNMNFYLPSNIANGDTMLTIKTPTSVNDIAGSVYYSYYMLMGNKFNITEGEDPIDDDDNIIAKAKPTDLTGVTFGVAALKGVNLKKGDKVTLIKDENGLDTDPGELKTTSSNELGKAKFLEQNNMTTEEKYELSIKKEGKNSIVTTVDDIIENETDPDARKSPVETRIGVMNMINNAGDMLAGQGMSNAAAAAAGKSDGAGFNSFAAVNYGQIRGESGSHVTNKGIGLNLGFARELENKSGKLLFGPVVEYGHGSYDSYQDNGMKADGKASYWGIGVIAKQTNNSGFYYEGSLRVGRTKSDYGSDSIVANSHISYDSSATYFAAHLGAGMLRDIGHDNTLDYYGKYFYSHTGGDSTTIYRNGEDFDRVDFDGVNSNRIRLGARVTHALNERNKIYGGLAYQYEFSGEARATYRQGSAPSPSMKGSSGMIELGWQVKPGSKSPMTIDLGVTGWVGKQRGITANVQANWTF